MKSAIRLARHDDLPRVEAIVSEAYRPYIARIGREPGPMLDDYAAMIDAGHVHVLATEDQIEGLVVLIPEHHSMLLDNVAVSPDAQGNGYGKRLLDFAEATARAAGCRSIRLYTNAAMVENIALYERLGFVETHRGEDSGFHRVYMIKHIV